MTGFCMESNTGVKSVKFWSQNSKKECKRKKGKWEFNAITIINSVWWCESIFFKAEHEAHVSNDCILKFWDRILVDFIFYTKILPKYFVFQKLVPQLIFLLLIVLRRTIFVFKNVPDKSTSFLKSCQPSYQIYVKQILKIYINHKSNNFLPKGTNKTSPITKTHLQNNFSHY